MNTVKLISSIASAAVGIYMIRKGMKETENYIAKLERKQLDLEHSLRTARFEEIQRTIVNFQVKHNILLPYGFQMDLVVSDSSLVEIDEILLQYLCDNYSTTK